ncbi:MAG TPA: right-handed parallel beta-helix repeat-containing protein [Pyrinomonadaceae bacterium]|jgi:hypothetical protein
MNKFRFTLNVLAIAIFTFAFASMAQAQATRTWVSGVGDDANPCSRTAPCKTFAGAISKTAVDGEIDALDPGGFGGVTITKSITIDGSPTGMAGLLVSGTNAIVINIQANSGSNTVQLRNISINGAGSTVAGNGIRVVGPGVANLAVLVENCLIWNFRSTSVGQGRGISDERTVAGSLYVQNTLVKNNGGSGIVAIGANGPTTVLNDVQAVKNGGAGVVVSGSTRSLVARNCVTAKNGVAGFLAELSSKMDVIDSSTSHHPQGIESDTSAEVRVSRSTVTRNTSNGLFLNGGTILSYGTNEVSANTGNETFTAGGPTLK